MSNYRPEREMDIDSIGGELWGGFYWRCRHGHKHTWRCMASLCGLFEPKPKKRSLWPLPLSFWIQTVSIFAMGFGIVMWDDSRWILAGVSLLLALILFALGAWIERYSETDRIAGSCR